MLKSSFGLVVLDYIVLTLALVDALWLARGVRKKALLPRIVEIVKLHRATQTDIHFHPRTEAERILRGGEMFVSAHGERWHSSAHCQRVAMKSKTPCMVC